MSMVINTNIAALQAHRTLNRNVKQVDTSFARLASGYRINRAADDAAGLNIAELMNTQVRGNRKALQNVQDGISMLQIAEGSLTVIGENLQRIRELTVQAASDIFGTSQRTAMAQEIRSRMDDIDRIAQASNFNGINLLDGTATNTRLQIGANSTLTTNTVDISVALASARIDLNTPGAGEGLALVDALGTLTFSNTTSIFDPVSGLSNFTNSTTVINFLGDIDVAINKVTTSLATIGSTQNQLDSISQNLSYAVENFEASRSRIKNLDIAEESSTLAQYQVLQQASVNILQRANDNPQMFIDLLRS